MPWCVTVLFVARPIITQILLGLDPNRYKNTAIGEPEQRHFCTFDSLMSDEERYKDATPFNIRCRSCEGTVEFAPVTDRTVSCLFRIMFYGGLISARSLVFFAILSGAEMPWVPEDTEHSKH